MRDPTQPPRLSRKAASAYLRDHHGLTIAAATLAKLAMQGDGPAYHKPSPRRSLYSVDALDAWVVAKIGPARTSTRDGEAVR